MPVEKMGPTQSQSLVSWVAYIFLSPSVFSVASIAISFFNFLIQPMQAIPQLSDRSKLPKIVDPVIRDTMDLKHLYQVCSFLLLLFNLLILFSPHSQLLLKLKQVAAVAVLCVQSEPSYRPLVTDVLHSLIPLVPVELGGSLRITEPLHPKVPPSTR